MTISNTIQCNNDTININIQCNNTILLMCLLMCDNIF